PARQGHRARPGVAGAAHGAPAAPDVRPGARPGGRLGTRDHTGGIAPMARFAPRGIALPALLAMPAASTALALAPVRRPFPLAVAGWVVALRSEEHTSDLQSRFDL